MAYFHKKLVSSCHLVYNKDQEFELSGKGVKIMPDTDWFAENGDLCVSISELADEEKIEERTATGERFHVPHGAEGRKVETDRKSRLPERKS